MGPGNNIKLCLFIYNMLTQVSQETQWVKVGLVY